MPVVEDPSSRVPACNNQPLLTHLWLHPSPEIVGRYYQIHHSILPDSPSLSQELPSIPHLYLQLSLSQLTSPSNDLCGRFRRETVEVFRLLMPRDCTPQHDQQAILSV